MSSPYDVAAPASVTSTGGLDMRLARLPVYTPYADKSYTKVKLSPGFCGKVTFVPWTDFDEEVRNTKKAIDKFPDFVVSYSRDILQILRKSLDPAASEEHQKRLRWYQSQYAQNSAAESVQNTASQRGALHRDAAAETSCTQSITNLESAGHQMETSTAQSGATAYTNAQSCAFMFENVFKIVEDLVRALRKSNEYHVLPQLTLNSELARAYDIASGPADYCTLTPDQALTTQLRRPASNLPVCSFELKGPLREFWRPARPPVPPPGRPPLGKKSKRPAKKQRVDKKGNADGKISRGAEGEARVEFSDKYAISRVVRTADAYNYSAEGLAEYYNDLFKNSSILNSEGSRYAYYFLFLPVAQALSQALLSDSGCCVLYNFQEAVAFQIRKKSKEGELGDQRKEADQARKDDQARKGDQAKEVPSLLVRVSRAFSCDEEPGNLCAVIALANYSCDELIKDDKRKLEIRDLFNEITDAFMDWKLEQEGGAKDKPRSNRPEKNADKNDGQQGTDASNETKQATTDAIYRSSADNFSSCSGDSLDGLTDAYDDAGSRTSSGCSNIMTEGDALIFTKALTKIIRNNDGVIGNGASAVVIGGTFEGRKVAVKSWNGNSPDGVKCLLHEIEIYRTLTERRAKVLGLGIPYMRMSRMIPAYDAVLVVDHVGRGIHRIDGGSLVLCDHDANTDANFCKEHGRRIEAEDIDGICHAAMESLGLLHESGVLHGDIALRNLRVEERKEKGRKSSWQAWWIDLGLSRPGGCTFLEAEVELEECGRLFPEAKVELMICAE